jgi:DNA-binding beta-propeller fold protein YncE
VARRRLHKTRAVLAAVMFCLLAVRPVGAASGDTVADAVLGAPDFFSASCNVGVASEDNLCGPTDVAMDPTSGRVFVSDSGHFRVMSWRNTHRLGSGEPADLVLGFPSLRTELFRTGGCLPDSPVNPPVSANCFLNPTSLSVDAFGHVYVTDTFLHRVLRFSPPFTTGQPADLVLGQADFLTSGCNRTRDFPGPAAPNSLCYPRGVAVDANGRVYISDSGNNRVIRFSPPFSNGQLADLVLGQPQFNSAACNVNGLNSRTLCEPFDISIGPASSLFVSDRQNHRVLRFTDPRVNWQTADLVIGQLDFNSSLERCGPGAATAENLCRPVSVSTDAHGNLFASDDNNRILRFASPQQSGQVANLVFGQQTFTSADCGDENGRVFRLGPDRLCSPGGSTFDFRGDLFVADLNNSRVLRYDMPIGGTAPPGSTVPLQGAP